MASADSPGDAVELLHGPAEVTSGPVDVDQPHEGGPSVGVEPAGDGAGRPLGPAHRAGRAAAGSGAPVDLPGDGEVGPVEPDPGDDRARHLQQAAGVHHWPAGVQ